MTRLAIVLWLEREIARATAAAGRAERRDDWVFAARMRAYRLLKIRELTTTLGQGGF
jgi:hypothetical protein